MGFGSNRYALILGMLAVAGAASGCGGGGSSNKGFASTVAPATSGSTAASTTSASGGTLAAGPRLQRAYFQDADNNGMISQGDKVVVAFETNLQPLPANLDPTREFELAVQGDSFGAGAKIEQGISANELNIVLGQNPVLHVSDDFSAGKTAAGSPSALNVSLFASGDILGHDAGPVAAAVSPADIGGSLQAGFRAAPLLNIARGGAGAVTLDDGRVLVVGGVTSGNKASSYVADAELFDPATNQWTRVADLSGTTAGRMMSSEKVAVKAVRQSVIKLTDGTVLICGGYGVEKRGLFGLGSEKVDTLESAFIFNPADNTFKRVGNMNWPRHSHTATLMSDGRVLVAGGYNDSLWSKDNTQAPFEIYDPAKGAFEKSGSIFSRFKSKEERQNHTATSIEGGAGILLVGGDFWKGGHLFGLIKPKLTMTKGSEVVRGTSTERAGDLNTPRRNHAAAAIGPRNVLIAGGNDLSSTVSQLELYDTATAQWTAAGDLAKGRAGCQILVDGNKAVIVGGFDGTAEVAQAEVFDADAKQLTGTTYALATARNSFSVVRLKDGRHLVVGGMTGGAKDALSLDGQGVASCEFFVRQ